MIIDSWAVARVVKEVPWTLQAASPNPNSLHNYRAVSVLAYWHWGNLQILSKSACTYFCGTEFDKWSSIDKEEEWGKTGISKPHRAVTFQKCPLSLFFQLVGIPHNPVSINHPSFPTRGWLATSSSQMWLKYNVFLFQRSKHRWSPF